MNEGFIGEPISAGALPGHRHPGELFAQFEGKIELDKVRAMLQQAREQMGAPGERICTANLVAQYFSEQQYERNLVTLEAAAAMHPGRLVVLISEPRQPGETVTVRVSILRPQGTPVIVERIVLTASGAAVRHLESAMTGLLVPEAPFVVIWGGRPEGDLLIRTAESADRVIIDSGTRPASALADVAWLVGRGAPIGDLSWGRITPWQTFAADLLDVPNLRQHRGALKSARVVCAGEAGAEGALLAGWFQSRVRKARVQLTAGPGPEPRTGPPTQLGRAPPPEPLTPGQVREFRFEAPGVEFVITRERSLLVAKVTGDDDGEVVHRVRLPPDTAGRTLLQELKLLMGRDDLYAQSVEAAVPFVSMRARR